MSSFPKSDIAQLSERAQSRLHRLLDQGETPGAIARAIQAQTKERVPAAAIRRYSARYCRDRKKQQRATHGLDGLLARMKEEGLEVSDLLRAVLVERLDAARRNGAAEELDLLKLEEAERKRGEYELKQRQANFSNLYRERELDLKERKHSLAEKEFQIQREKARANFQELERKAHAGQSLTPDDVRRIREIFGLYDDPEATETKRHGE